MPDIEELPGVADLPQEEESNQSIQPDPKQPRKNVHDWLRDMRMSASVNKTTVGVESERVTPELLLATSKKLLKINRREAEQDQKDSLEFQRIYGPTDYFAEHVLRDADRLGRQLLWKATNKGNLDFMPTNALDQHVSSVFNSSKLTNMIDASSPLEPVEASFKVSRIGEGGLGSMESAPEEMRLVQPSFLGYIDSTATPESLKVGLDNYMTKHCMKGSDGKLYQKFINAHTGKEELVDSVTAAKSIVATPEMMDAKTNFVFAVGGSKGARIVKKSDVDYYLPRMDDAFTNASNLVPMMSSVKELRLRMGCLHPSTGVLVVSKRNEVDIIPAKDVSKSSGSIPGASDKGASECYPISMTVAKLPQNRAWFKKVVLYSGRTLITSRDHRWSILVEDVDGNKSLKLVQCDKLKPGDKVLRSFFKDVPNRRTFLNEKLVNQDMAILLGYAVRTLVSPDDEKLTITYQPRHKDNIKRALERMCPGEFKIYVTARKHTVSFASGWFYDWLKSNVHVREQERRIPSCILSANLIVSAAFLDAYTADETKVGIDQLECFWILEIPNSYVREGLAFLLARSQTDTLFRDSHRSQEDYELALKLVDDPVMFGDCIVDEIKAVLPVESAPIMVDIDIDDRLYATANGVITHNSKYPQQAVPIEGREAPLVRPLDEQTGKDMYSRLGKFLGARYTPKAGTVSAVRNDRIDMVYDDGTKGSISLYKNFPMNAKGYLNNIPQVKAGMHLGKNALVASSNYTDKDGVGATGTNLRAAWMSWHGGTYEDAIVLSESAAKKLTSTTMYASDLDLDKTVSLGKKNYLAWKPGEYTKEQMSILDDDGIVKPGTVVQKGDPLVLAVRTSEPSPGTMGKRILTDISTTWEHDHPGVITDIVKTRNGVRVLSTVTAPVEIGDKLSNMFGGKGVVGKIYPDDQMPHDKDGKPLDILFSPLGLISRCNPAMLHEAMLGKIAHKTGKPITMPAFSNKDLYEYISDQLKQNHLSPDDDFYDPETGRKIPDIINGYSYIHKLKHLSESKMSARGTGTYTMDDTPGGSGYDSGKRYGTLEISSFIGHGAFDNLLDSKLLRGQANADFWRELRTGGIPTIPGEPLVQKKFFAHLQGAGVNVRKTPKGISVFALSNKDVNELAGPREVRSRDTFEAKNYRPIDGGLFGQDVFGINGDHWGYIQLDEPVPNPVMAEPLARLLRMSDKDFTAVASGLKEVDGMSNSTQLRERLAKYDLATESKKAKEEFKNATPSKKDAALKRYVAVENMRRAGLNPSEYMLDRIPVLPPEFRPVTSSNGLTMVADANYLYAQILDARDDMREAKDLPKEYQDKARANLYNKWQELTGLYDPEDVKLRNKNVGGLLQWALGKGSPKFSAFHRKVLGHSVDTVGRGVIIPSSKISINEIGVPVKMAMDMMAPFVERGLVNRGYTPVDAMKMVKARDKQALDVLDEVVKNHPVIMNRAPTLHKYNMMAFNPVLVQGNSIQVNPSVCPGFNADFDGDQQIGIVKLRISKELLKNEKIIENLEQSELQKIVTILYYATGKEGNTCNTRGDLEMAYKNLRTQLRIRNQEDDRYIVMDMDLADIPHGRLVTKNGGTKGNADFYEALPGMQVLAYDETVGSLKWADIAYWSEHHGCEVELVHLNNGCDIITDDDPRAVYGIAKDADSLVPQRFTPTEAMKAHVCVPFVKPGVSFVPVEEEFHYVRELDGAPLRSKCDDTCYELTFEFGQFLGLLAGDGWWDKKDREHLQLFGGPRGIYMSDNEGENAAYVTKFIKEHIDADAATYVKEFTKEQYPERYGDTVRFSTLSVKFDTFNELLTRILGGCSDDVTTGAGNKHLPTWIQAAPYEFRRGLLCGLISTDGSVSVSRGKGKEQLMIGFCSTSLRLCRELCEICRSLGVRTSISFSKTTVRNNKAWQVTISTFDAKQRNTLIGMSNTRKEQVFKDTSVSDNMCHSHGDYRVYPKCVSDVVSKWMRAPKVPKENASGVTEEERRTCRQTLTLYMSLKNYVKKGYVTYGVVQQLKEYADNENKRIQQALTGINETIAKLEQDVNCELTEDWKHSMWRYLTTLEPQLDHDLFVKARVIVSRRASTFGKGCQGLLDILRKVVASDIKLQFGLSEEPLFKQWLDMSLMGNCAWTFIDDVEKPGQVETGYDLTVPGYETFVATNGIVLSNTVNIHVPISDRARKEALEKMLPSRNLFAYSNHKAMYKPEKEYIQGLYIATRMGKAPNGRAQTFRTFEEARDAYHKGIIDVDTPIQIIENRK